MAGAAMPYMTMKLANSHRFFRNVSTGTNLMFSCGLSASLTTSPRA